MLTADGPAPEIADIADQVIDLPTVPGLFVTTDLPDDRKALAQLPSASADICSCLIVPQSSFRHSPVL
jgi:hypothetical protein